MFNFSMFLLLFCYIGFIILYGAFQDVKEGTQRFHLAELDK